MRKVQINPIVESLCWVTLAGFVLALASLLGCSESEESVLSPSGFETTIGSIKSDTVIEIVKAVSTSNASPAAPRIVKQVESSNNFLIVYLSHRETKGDNDDEIIIIEAAAGALLAGDKIKFYVEAQYIGQVEVEGTSLSEIHVRLDLGDNEGEVMTQVDIYRNGKIIADAELKIRISATWEIIPHGLYKSGNQMLISLEHFGYKVSPWAEEILSSPRFKVEENTGETVLYRVTEEELGLTGIYTMADIIPATIRAGYRLVPEETAAQLRLLYRDQPEGELITVVSSPVIKGEGTYVFALGGGSVQYPGKHLIAVNARAALGEEYQSFVVTK